MYMEKFGLSAVQMGSYLAIGNAMHIPAGFLWAALESVLLVGLGIQKLGLAFEDVRVDFLGVPVHGQTVRSTRDKRGWPGVVVADVLQHFCLRGEKFLVHLQSHS